MPPSPTTPGAAGASTGAPTRLGPAESIDGLVALAIARDHAEQSVVEAEPVRMLGWLDLGGYPLVITIMSLPPWTPICVLPGRRAG
jgi:hypothetical protein